MALEKLPRKPRNYDKHTYYAVRDGITLAEFLQDVPDQTLVCLGSKFAGGFFAALPKEDVLEACPGCADMEVLEAYERFLGGIAILLALTKVGQWDCETVPWSQNMAMQSKAIHPGMSAEHRKRIYDENRKEEYKKKAEIEREKKRRNGYCIAMVAKLQGYLAASGMQKKAFAELIGVSPCTVSSYAAGKSQPKYKVAMQIDAAIEKLRAKEGKSHENRRPA